MATPRTILPNPRAAIIKQRSAEAEKRRVEREALERKKTPENQTSAYRLFNRSFKVFVERGFLYDETYIERYGMLGENIHGGDKDVVNSMTRFVEMSLPASDLNVVVIEREGKSTYFYDVKDAAECYDIIVTHLEAWADYINQPSINYRNIPWVDIRNLDNLAAWVYGKVYGYFATNHDIVGGGDVGRDAAMLHLFGNIHGGNDLLSTNQLERKHVRHISEEHVSIFEDIIEDRIPSEVLYG